MIALATTSIAWLLVMVILLGWVVYAFLNVRQARAELGSEIELAANRKEFFDDEILEGPRLERVLGFGVILLATIVIGLPAYWILEPGRMAGATESQEALFVEWGSRLFAATADGGFNCAGCHGGMTATGGEASYNLSDPTTGDVTSVNWKAPALNTIFYRFSEEEVRHILVYGRAFSPMPPWGTQGGGPMNTQQINTLIAYLKSIQIPREDCGVGEDDPLSCASGHLPIETQNGIDMLANRAVDAGEFATYGEALFNTELASGAFSCARCHTPGWSWGNPGVAGQGALGPNLTGGRASSVFPNEADMIDFIKNGSSIGAKYGRQGQGSGRMPGFGAQLSDAQIQAIVEYVRGL